MDSPNRVALCVTCIVDQLMPEVGVASVKVLRRAGCQVDFPAEQTCCGQPFYNSGYRKQAAQLAKRTIEIFEPHETVVLPSGSCTSMIRTEYGHLFEDSPIWSERAQKLAGKTFELSEYLVHHLGWQPEVDTKHELGPLTYHDSCHMNRLLHLRDEPRQLLTGTGYSLCEMSESDRCCGFGGIFSLRMPEVSTAMTAEKLRQAAETGAKTIVTADPGCLMQMRELAGDEGQRFEHLATMLEEGSR
jgi:L-lactate dehydrogenase complex protein LldE